LCGCQEQFIPQELANPEVAREVFTDRKLKPESRSDDDGEDINNDKITYMENK
jgi:hypothetical protein